jgi:hypothetical protein
MFLDISVKHSQTLMVRCTYSKNMSNYVVTMAPYIHKNISLIDVIV